MSNIILVEGEINGIKYHKTSDYSEAGNKYLIASFNDSNDGRQYTIKGEMNSVIIGWRYRLYGNWKTSNYGEAFEFVSFDPIIDRSHDGMADYLARQVPTIGKQRARLIVGHFGDESFQVLKTDPSRLKEVSGIPLHARQAVEKFFRSDNLSEIDPSAYARLFDVLSPIRPKRSIILSLLRNFGSNAPQFISENPYRLLDYPGMGWISVDKLAIEVLKYNRSGLDRHKAAVLEILARNSESGHTYTDLPTIRCESSILLKSPLNIDAIKSLSNLQDVYISENDHISLSNLYESELSIAQEIKRLQESGDKLDFEISADALEDEQRQIPLMVEEHSVCIITGIPGSGKSFSISRIIDSIYKNGITNIIVIAPTGKAAKRNQEFLHDVMPDIPIPCMTIHRALGGKPSSEKEEGVPQDESKVNRGRDRFVFLHDEENQLPFQVFIVDECSMMDCSLASSFLKAVPSGSRLIIVGDHYQLPSVGPGSVLRDLMALLPHVTLDKPRRNSGVIAHACYLIKEGRTPNPSQLLKEFGESNWTHVEKQTDSDILNSILKTHENYINKYGIEAAKANLQVISPEKKGVLGCNNLNTLLSKIVNPQPETTEFFKLGGSTKDEDSAIRPGDKIVRTKNGTVKVLLSELIDQSEPDFDNDQDTIIFNNQEYTVSSIYIVNGDMGEVAGFYKNNIIVRFINPDRLCMLPKSDANISLAYALTCHKMQGSSSPICIVPLIDFYWNTKTNTGLFSRELVYTTFSRPSQRLITIGRLGSLSSAISRVTINHRKTKLAEMMKQYETINA